MKRTYTTLAVARSVERIKAALTPEMRTQLERDCPPGVPVSAAELRRINRPLADALATAMQQTVLASQGIMNAEN